MASAFSSPRRPDTKVVALGRPAHAPSAPLNPPVQFTSTFVSEGVPQAGELTYARYSNPTWEPLEEAIANLEGTEVPGLLYGSGMAAVTAAFALVPIGGTVVVPASAYNGTIGLARELAAQGAVVLREVDPSNTEQVIAALQGADLVWLESPTNPLLDIADVPAIAKAAREAGALVVVDNTFSTPLRQNPLSVGADVVVHSATKYIAGHSDVILGIIVVSNPELRATLLARRTLSGAIAGPMEAWLALRGLRTMAVRLDRTEETAGELARRLEDRAELSRVRYPGLASHPHHERAKAQLSGFGGVIAVEVKGGPDAADAFVSALSLFTPATSLGGVESLVERRRRHPGEPTIVPAELVRLSIGIENVEDLWADLEAGLRAAAAFAS